MKSSLAIIFDRLTSRRLWIALGLLLCCPSWLFAAATGETNANAVSGDNPQVTSNYSNANKRPDPFLPVKLKGKGPEQKVAFSESELHVKGILWHPTKPVAIINRQSIALNETVTFKLSTGEHTAQAISIERDKVVLRMGEKEITLRLER